MRQLNARLLWWSVLAGALALLWLLPLPANAAPTAHSFEIDAQQFAFAPERIEVNQGDVVTIHLSASDVVHGFYLDGYGIEQSVTPGITREITFIADQPGKFRYRCSVSCGALHPFMIGELVVNGNTPLWRAFGTIGISMVGFLFYLWQFRGKQNEYA